MKSKKEGFKPNKLREIRETKGLTKQQVSKYLGFRDSETLDAWESGLQEITGESLMRLLIIYNVNLRDIFGDRYEELEKEMLQRSPVKKKK